MKKIFAMMLAFAMIFLVTACSSHPAIKKADGSKQGNGYIAGVQIGLIPGPETGSRPDIQTLLQPWEKAAGYGQTEPLPIYIGDYLGSQPEWVLAEGKWRIPNGQRILPALTLPDKTGEKAARFVALWTVAKAAGNRQGSFCRTGRAGIYQAHSFFRSRGP